MRPIHLARLDKSRPVLVLTRDVVRPHLNTVTIAPITTTVRGLSTEVLCGTANGLEQPSAVACDNMTTILIAKLGKQIGRLLDEQRAATARPCSLRVDPANAISPDQTRHESR